MRPEKSREFTDSKQNLIKRIEIDGEWEKIREFSIIQSAVYVFQQPGRGFFKKSMAGQKQASQTKYPSSSDMK